MKKKFRYFLSSILVTMLIASTAVAAEDYTVEPVDVILYSTPEAVLYETPDITVTPVLPAEAFQEDLAIHVIGITSNGYYQVSLEKVYYIPANGLQERTQEEQNVYGTLQREQEVYNIMIAQKANFPEGMRYTNDNYYDWNGGTYYRGYGCAGFAFYLSDLAFGNKIAEIHRDYTNLHVGDILRINNNTHSVIILEVKTNSVIVAEANYNSSVHWGREISLDKIQDNGSYIMTRY